MPAIDEASRRFAAAYHAPDALPAERIDALREAAAMVLVWSRQLDEAGLSRAPATFRTDPALLTFEDVANRPAKLWRQEGIALLQVARRPRASLGSTRPPRESARRCIEPIRASSQRAAPAGIVATPEHAPVSRAIRSAARR